MHKDTGFAAASTSNYEGVGQRCRDHITLGFIQSVNNVRNVQERPNCYITDLSYLSHITGEYSALRKNVIQPV